MAAEVNTGGAFQPGIPRPLFKVPPGVYFGTLRLTANDSWMAAPSTSSAVPRPRSPSC